MVSLSGYRLRIWLTLGYEPSQREMPRSTLRHPQLFRAFHNLSVSSMQLRLLRYFVKIVEAGSFSRAAATIQVAQPALSQQIAELEEQLGLSLLQRSARGVRPTPAGGGLFPAASSVLRQVEAVPGIVRSSVGETEGTVGLGMSSTLAASLGGPFIESCKAALPKATL